MWRARRLSLLLAAAAAPALAGSPAHDAAFEQLRAQDLRVAKVHHLLASNGSALCPDILGPVTGIVLHHRDQYHRRLRPAAMAYFGLRSEPGVMAVVPGSAAARAGIREDDAILAVGERALAPGHARSARRASYAAVAQTHATIETALADGAIILAIRRGGANARLHLEAEPGCRSRIQVLPSEEHNAWSQDADILISTAMLDFARSDDELAILIGHELAHIVLDGRRTRENSASRKVREMEADALGLRLAAAAGFDVRAAPAFWMRLASARRRGPWVANTHPTGAERAAALEKILAEMAAEPAS